MLTVAPNNMDGPGTLLHGSINVNSMKIWTNIIAPLQPGNFQEMRTLSIALDHESSYPG